MPSTVRRTYSDGAVHSTGTDTASAEYTAHLPSRRCAISWRASRACRQPPAPTRKAASCAAPPAWARRRSSQKTPAPPKTGSATHGHTRGAVSGRYEKAGRPVHTVQPPPPKTDTPRPQGIHVQTVTTCCWRNRKTNRRAKGNGTKLTCS